ncbi:unnamed protein product [Closterium sp. Yama58-4]|nr:unnamed protein product [Closterium sp. Yama58-4]
MDHTKEELLGLMGDKPYLWLAPILGTVQGGYYFRDVRIDWEEIYGNEAYGTVFMRILTEGNALVSDFDPNSILPQISFVDPCDPRLRGRSLDIRHGGARLALRYGWVSREVTRDEMRYINEVRMAYRWSPSRGEVVPLVDDGRSWVVPWPLEGRGTDINNEAASWDIHLPPPINSRICIDTRFPLLRFYPLPEPPPPTPPLFPNTYMGKPLTIVIPPPPMPQYAPPQYPQHMPQPSPPPMPFHASNSPPPPPPNPSTPPPPNPSPPSPNPPPSSPPPPSPPHSPSPSLTYDSISSLPPDSPTNQAPSYSPDSPSTTPTPSTPSSDDYTTPSPPSSSSPSNLTTSEGELPWIPRFFVAMPMDYELEHGEIFLDPFGRRVRRAVTVGWLREPVVLQLEALYRPYGQMRDRPGPA